MYFYVEKTKGKRIDHARKIILECDDSIPFGERDKTRTINKGEKVLVFDNGTIGKGRISYNYSKNAAIKILKRLIRDLENE